VRVAHTRESYRSETIEFERDSGESSRMRDRERESERAGGESARVRVARTRERKRSITIRTWATVRDNILGPKRLSWVFNTQERSKESNDSVMAREKFTLDLKVVYTKVWITIHTTVKEN